MSEAYNILVVEDDDQFRSMVHELLNTENYNVTEAVNSEDALEKAESQSFHLAITDLLMPGEGGFKFIRKMRTHDASVKIIAMSGGNAKTEAEDCLFLAGRFKADIVMKKPFGKDELLNNIKTLLAG